MDIRLFNLCLAVGWLMVTGGLCMVHPGWGLAAGGAVLLGLTFVSAWLGGVHASAPKTGEPR